MKTLELTAPRLLVSGVLVGLTYSEDDRHRAIALFALAVWTSWLLVGALFVSESEPLPDFFKKLKADVEQRRLARVAWFKEQHPWSERTRVIQEYAKEEFPADRSSIHVVTGNGDHLVAIAAELVLDDVEDPDGEEAIGMVAILRTTDDYLKTKLEDCPEPAITMKAVHEAHQDVYVTSLEQGRAIVRALLEAFGPGVLE